MTLALALVANLAWLYFILRYAGPKAILKDWFGNIDDHESLQILEDANIRFLANGPRLQSTMPRIHNDLQRRLQFGFDPPPPPETVSALTYNDRMMGSLLQHRIGQVDFAPVRRDAI